MADLPDGVRVARGLLGAADQRALAEEIGALLAAAPPFRPRMPRTGRPFSVTMSNAGPLGWVSDEAGYRYQPNHPETGRPWPPIPELVLALWREVTGYPAPPEACLINLYDAKARMGLHQDRDEAALDAPVLSISLGAAARFRLGGMERGGRTGTLILESGDVLAIGGPSRLVFHGIDKVLPGTSPLPALPYGAARINLTLRRVTRLSQE